MKNRLKLSTLLVFSLFNFSPYVMATTPLEIDQLTQKWLAIENQTRTLHSDWKVQQPILEQRLLLLSAEKKQLTTVVEKNITSSHSVDNRRTELLTEQSRLEQQQRTLAHALIRLQSRSDQIAALLPAILASSWAKETNTLSDNATPSEQLQVILAQLTQLMDFDQRISVHEETLKTDDGRDILVKQLFLGTGMAWYSSRDGQFAGWGQATQDHWQWHHDPEIASDEILTAIAMFEKRKTAELVRLPMNIMQNSENAEQEGAQP